MKTTSVLDLRMGRWDDDAWKGVAIIVLNVVLTVISTVVVMIIWLLLSNHYYYYYYDDAWKGGAQDPQDTPSAAPLARRNAAAASLGHRIIVSGGYNDEEFRSLEDTWSFNMRTGRWAQIAQQGAPRMEGHKAVASGLDIFTFGGHALLGRFPRPTVSVHRLALGKADPLQAYSAAPESRSNLKSSEKDSSSQGYPSQHHE